ncbi:hypothetical protein QFC24_000505 [Naganishia onofrii]|uniref:Uncharacterized protein n=1 Tax=Naganishia onofrii TaxID=1851511 RepID=A0ACC2XW14_9TREE|nr:hypothetical protein QFC24_000505 [Naganishia onofrii]
MNALNVPTIPSVDLHTLFEREKEAGGFYDHLEMWIDSSGRKKKFIKDCMAAVLVHLEARPRVRDDGREPQFHTEMGGDGTSRLASPYGGKSLVQRLLLRRITVGGRETQAMEMTLAMLLEKDENLCRLLEKKLKTGKIEISDLEAFPPATGIKGPGLYLIGCQADGVLYYYIGMSTNVRNRMSGHANPNARRNHVYTAMRNRVPYGQWFQLLLYRASPDIPVTYLYALETCLHICLGSTLADQGLNVNMYDWPAFESRITPAQVEGIFMFLAEKKQQRETRGGAFYFPASSGVHSPIIKLQLFVLLTYLHLLDTGTWSSLLRDCDTGGLAISTIINLIYGGSHRVEQEEHIERYGLSDCFLNRSWEPSTGRKSASQSTNGLEEKIEAAEDIARLESVSWGGSKLLPWKRSA